MVSEILRLFDDAVELWRGSAPLSHYLLGASSDCRTVVHWQVSCIHWVFLRCRKIFSFPSCCHELFVWNLKEVGKFLLTWDVSPVMSSPTQPHTLKLGHFSSSGSPIKTGKEWNWFNINVPSLKFAEKVLSLFKICMWSPQKWGLYCKCTVYLTWWDYGAASSPSWRNCNKGVKLWSCKSGGALFNLCFTSAINQGMEDQECCIFWSTQIFFKDCTGQVIVGHDSYLYVGAFDNGGCN